MFKLFIFNFVICLLVCTVLYFNLNWLAISIVVALILFDCFIIYFERNLLGGAGGLESEFEDNIEETKKEK